MEHLLCLDFRSFSAAAGDSLTFLGILWDSLGFFEDFVWFQVVDVLPNAFWNNLVGAVISFFSVAFFFCFLSFFF